MNRTIKKFLKTASAADMFKKRLEKEVAEEDSRQEDQRRSSGRIREELVEEMHRYIDDAIEKRKYRLDHAANQKDTSRHWKLFSAAMEEGFIRLFDLKRGRSKGKSPRYP